MTPNHPRNIIEIVEGLIKKVRDLQGQLSAATPKLGTATLTAGAVTVALPAVTANSKIMLTTQVPAGTLGTPYVFSKTPGTGFVIKSTSATDTSTVAYAIF